MDVTLPRTPNKVLLCILLEIVAVLRLPTLGCPALIYNTLELSKTVLVHSGAQS